MHVRDEPHVDEKIEQWFREWRNPVRHWLSRQSRVPASDLDDLAQEVFLRVLRYSQNTNVEKPLGYLLRIASNVASEWRGLARVAKPHDSSWLDELLIDEVEEPENFVERYLYQDRLSQVIATLPARQRQVLMLTVQEGWNCPQIAAELSVSERVVYRDRGRAYDALRLTVLKSSDAPVQAAAAPPFPSQHNATTDPDHQVSHRDFKGTDEPPMIRREVTGLPIPAGASDDTLPINKRLRLDEHLVRQRNKAKAA